jgi:hypothetical protein
MPNKKPKSQKNIYQAIAVLMLVFVLASGIITFEFQRQENQKISNAAYIVGGVRSTLTPSSQDVFSCAGRNDCPDDDCKTACSDGLDNDGMNGIDLADSGCTNATDNSEGAVSNTCTVAGPQHKYVAQAYDQFGFPLTGVKYQWSKMDVDDLIKFRDQDVLTTPSDSSEDTAGDVNQNIYVEPNSEALNNGKAVVNVLGYIDDVSSGKQTSIDIDLFFCLNAWPNTAVFPFEDKSGTPANAYSNFKTFYCKDRGSVADPGDDYPALKVVERGLASANDMVCSGGGGNGLKCDSDFIIWHDGVVWQRVSGINLPTPLTATASVSSTDKLFFSRDQWIQNYLSGSNSGTLGTTHPFSSWPDGAIVGKPLIPTAIGWDGNNILLIEGNSFRRSTDGGTSWSVLGNLSSDAVYGPWSTDVQFPTEVAMWNDGTNDYTMVLKDDYYRIYSDDNTCESDKVCKSPTGRKWGRCSTSVDCSWGEKYSLYDAKSWPTSIAGWKDNIKYPIKTLALENSAGYSRMMATGSCEYSGGTCLLKEFLFISNPACSDKIDNDGDTFVDLLDSDCLDANDNSESGTCDDGIDNDEDGTVDYPDDFSCAGYAGVESDFCDAVAPFGTADFACCDNKDNDNDGLIDQKDPHCSQRGDSNEVSACANNLDDDGDGKTDIVDSGCVDTNDDNEYGATQCDDGKDNDGDGKTDTAGANLDPDCGSLMDDNESI